MQGQYIPPPNAKRHAAGRMRLYEQYGKYCFKCHALPGPGSRILCLDHIVPIARGGFDVYANWQILCVPCNTKKGTKIIDYRPGTRHLDIVGTRPLQRMEDRVLRRRRTAPDLANPRREYLTVAQAATRLGIAEVEVLRRIRLGTLKADKFERPQGLYTRVILEDDEPMDNQIPTEHEPPSPAMDVSAAIAAAVGPLTELVRGQAETIAALSELRGQWQERAVAANRRADELAAERDAARAEVDRLRRPFWRRWWG